MKFLHEHIPDKVFHQEKQLERDCLSLWNDKEYHLPQKYDSSLQVPTEQVFHRKHSFEWEFFQWADSEFVQWAKKQPPTMVIAIMANMKQSPLLSPELEEWRQKVNQVPLYPIETYAEKKRLGQRSIQFLKDMHKQYGDSVLRILYLTSA